MRFGLLFVLVFTLLSCGGRPSEPAPAVRTIEAPQMLISGCRVRTETTCERLFGGAPQPLRVWLDLAPNATVIAEFDGVRLPASVAAAGRGVAISLQVPPNSGMLRVSGMDPAWSETLDVEIQWRVPPLITVLARQAESRQMSRLALWSLEVALFFESRPQARIDMLQTVRVLARQAGRSRLGLTAQNEARELARRTGASFDLAELSLISVFSELRRGNVAAGRWTLKSLEELPGLPVELRAGRAYYNGMVEMTVGDLVAASRHFETAVQLSERVADRGRYFAAVAQLAVSRSELGDTAAAVSAATSGLRQLAGLRDDCRLSAQTQGILGWAVLRVAEDPVLLETARQAFLAALDAFVGECRVRGKAENQLVNLAWTALLDWELDEAQAYVEELEAGPIPPHLQAWVGAIKTRIAHLSGNEVQLDSPVLEPRTAPRDPFLAWDAEVSRGERLHSHGLSAAAAEQFEAAEARLAKESDALGSAIVQDSFLARRNDSLVGLVDSLVSSGQAAEAACRVRLALRRAVLKSDRAARIDALDSDRLRAWNRAMETYVEARARAAHAARDDWKFDTFEVGRRQAARKESLAQNEQQRQNAQSRLVRTRPLERCADLPRRASGVANLIVLLLEETGTVFLEDERGVFWAQEPVQAGDEERWAVTVLGRLPLDSSVEVLRIVANGPGGRVPWARIPVNGVPVADLALLEWGLDLPRRDGHGKPGEASIFGDPTGDLPAARSEAGSVAHLLQGGPWTVSSNLGNAATVGSMRTALESASLVYFAGHGSRTPVPGPGTEGLGWEDSLTMSDGQLGVPELLGLSAAPARAVLAGCDSGTTASSGLGGGLNLGRALLLAGAQEVVVASGKTDDVDARVLGIALARSLAADPEHRMSDALRSAQSHLRETRPSSRWWQFRVLVP